MKMELHIASDGKVFHSYQDCEEHESKLDFKIVDSVYTLIIGWYKSIISTLALDSTINSKVIDKLLVELKPMIINNGSITGSFLKLKEMLYESNIQLDYYSLEDRLIIRHSNLIDNTSVYTSNLSEKFELESVTIIDNLYEEDTINLESYILFGAFMSLFDVFEIDKLFIPKNDSTNYQSFVEELKKDVKFFNDNGIQLTVDVSGIEIIVKQ